MNCDHQFHSYATVEIYEVLEGVDIEKEKKNEQTKTKYGTVGLEYTRSDLIIGWIYLQ